MAGFHKKALEGFGVFVAFCVLAAVAILVIELVFPVSEHASHVLHSIDSLLIFIFIADLCISFMRAYDKRGFLRMNWLLMFSYLPAIRLMKISGMKKLTELFRLFRHREHLSHLNAIGLGGVALQARKLGTKLAELKVSIPVKLPSPAGIIMGKGILISLYSSPAADRQFCKGVVEGTCSFMRKKLHARPVVARQDWYRTFRAEHELAGGNAVDASLLLKHLSQRIGRQGLNIIITDNELEFSSSLTDFSAFLKKGQDSSYFLFSSFGLDGHSSTYPYEIEKQKHMRGFIVGYNTMVERFAYRFMRRKCSEQHCIHQRLRKGSLDLLSFLSFMNRRHPICNVHAA